MNNLSIESHDFNMQKLLSDQKRYVVPLYQRPLSGREETTILHGIFYGTRRFILFFNL